MAVDLVLTHGVVHTLNSRQPLASALAIGKGLIRYVGDAEGARELAGPSTEIIDLGGRCVLPGLTDAHMHLEGYALALRMIDVETATLPEALARVAERARTTPGGAWIRGRGWNHNVWGNSFPTAGQLDAVAPGNPVCLGAKSGHGCWLNSAALAQARITADTPDPPGGQIVRDSAGQPTGILLEGAMGLLYDLLPEPDEQELAEAMAGALSAANRAGLTSLHSMDGGRCLRAAQILRDRGQLSAHLVVAVPLALLDAALALGLASGWGDEWLRLGPVKMFADGALGPRTAWMLAGYETAPEDTGFAAADFVLLREAVSRANAAGLGCAIHAIGDRANREVLDIYQAGGRPGMRNRVEHLQILHPDDVPRVGRLGVVASMQPLQATSDMAISDRHLGARAGEAYVFRTLLDAGAVLAFGSDCPVEPINPLLGIQAAVTRRRRDGSPGAEGWHPEQRLTVEEAVRAYTWGAAYAAGLEQRLGMLAPGRLADLTVLDRDPWAVDTMEITEIGVSGTVVGGEWVWRDAAL